MHRRFLQFFFMLFCLVLIGTAFAASPLEDPKKIPWKISAVSVSFDQEKSVYIARGEVIITGGQTRLEADYVEFSNQTKDTLAMGDVLLVAGEDAITCDAMQFNLATETGIIEQGHIFIQKNNIHIKGDTIKKTGKDTYTLAKGTLTSCDGESPDWKVTGRDIEVTIEGYGFAKHTVLWAKKLPAIYSPFLAFPVKTKRQSGLLAPRFGSSSRTGFEYDQPLFLALSRDTDATISTDYLADRGVKFGLEYRYVLSPQSKGTLYYDYLNDRTIGDSTEDNQDYSFGSTPDRTNHDRYWFRMKVDQELPAGFTGKLDIDYVSDADYLLEFKDGITGYNSTDDEFEEGFGRGLDSYDDTTRKNSLTLNRNWGNYSLTAQALWYDDVLARQDENRSDTNLQTLPQISFDATRQEIGNSRFYYTLDSEVASFYRKDTTATLVNGQRLDVYPKLYRPTVLGKSFHITPYVGTRGTLWYTDNFTDADNNDDNLRSRFVLDTGTDFYFKLTKVFSPGLEMADRIQHELIPKITYRYVPEVDQDDLPSFTSIDRITEENQFTWTLSNTFTGKTFSKDPTPVARYRQLLWFELAQDYSLLDTDTLEAEGKNRWSDIRLKVEAYPVTYLSLDSDIYWDPYKSRFTKTDVGATLRNNRGDSLSTTLRYTKGGTNSVTNTIHTWKTRLDIQATRDLLLYYSVEMDRERDRTIESILGLRYTQDCWTLALEGKEDTEREKSIAVMIILRGLGGFGTL